MKVALLSLAALATMVSSAPAPKADPEAFFPLGAIALPAITGNALIDGLLVGKVALLKAAILANLLLGSSDESADEAEYGAPAQEYGAPAQEYAEPAQDYAEPAPSYEEPAPSYDAPALSYGFSPVYDAPAPSYDAPDTYGAPVADALPSYDAPAYYKF